MATITKTRKKELKQKKKKIPKQGRNEKIAL